MKRIVVFLLFSVVLNLYGQINLNFANSNADPDKVAVIRYLLDAFELYNPGISVQILTYNENDSLDKIIEGENGITPDLIMADSLILYRLAERKVLNSTIVESLLNNVIDKNDFYTGGLNAFYHNSEYVGIPYSAWLQVLWYRKDWFEENDLEKPDSISALLNAAHTIHNQEIGRYGIILGSGNDTYTEQCFLHLAGALGLDISGDPAQLHIEKEIMKESVENYLDLTSCTPDGEQNWRSRDYYFQDRAAMLFYSTHLMDDLVLRDISLDSLTGEYFTELSGKSYTSELFNNTGMVTTISGVNKSSYGSISGFGVFNNRTPEKTVAMEKLIEFFYRTDVYITWLHMSPGGMLPVIRSLLEDDNFYRYATSVFSKFGRDKIAALTEGIENLKILNPELLMENPLNEYEEKDFLSYIYLFLQNPLEIENKINSRRWIR